MTPRIAALTAAPLALGYIALALRVIQARYAARVSLGTGGDRRVERAMRVHANFAEYVPFALLLLALLELTGGSAWLVAGLGVALVAGRAAHAFGMSREPEPLRWRTVGMAATFGVLATTALALLVIGVIG